MPNHRVSLSPASDTIPEPRSSALARQVASHYDAFAGDRAHAVPWKQGYYGELVRLLRHIVPEGQRILEIGCGEGSILRALKPSEGVGIEVSPAMVQVARGATDGENFRFIIGDACLEETFAAVHGPFDFILLVGTAHELWDVQNLLDLLRRCCGPRTRLVVLGYSRLWQLPLAAAALLGLKRSQPMENWIPPEVLRNLISHSGFEPIREYRHLVCPLPLGPVSRWVNRYVGHLPGIDALSLLSCMVARPVDVIAGPRGISRRPAWSIVIPCRNEAGHIADLHAALPEMPDGSEVIWVEGNSTDDTEATIRELIACHPDRPYRFLKQPGKGKGDAVRHAFAAARGDLLAILDADITVSPCDLPKFFGLLEKGSAEFVNGTRLVYSMESGAMRFLNLVANKLFALTLKRITGQFISDTLCGTKAMWRADYEKLSRDHLFAGTTDPFGDFDLLLGAARAHLKIAEVPVRYGERKYGDTNIARFSDGWRLLRMTGQASMRMHFI